MDSVINDIADADCVPNGPQPQRMSRPSHYKLLVRECVQHADAGQQHLHADQQVLQGLAVLWLRDHAP